MGPSVAWRQAARNRARRQIEIALIGSDTMVDTETRHQVYFANRTALIAYATRIVGSRETAEDIVQEAFIRFAPANTGSESSGLSPAYLYRIVRNLSLDL